jgi:hypothetical protein
MGGDVYRRFRAAAVQAAPVDRHPFYRRLHDNAIEVPSPQVDRLGDIARRRRVVLSVGVTKKGTESMGTMWNTNQSPHGKQKQGIPR